VFGRRQSPFGISGRHVIAAKIGGLVTGFAAHGGDAVAVLATFHVLQVDVTVVALQGSVASGVAILAARRGKDFVNLQECLAGSGCVWLGRRG
jgi:hypothetical protein